MYLMFTKVSQEKDSFLVNYVVDDVEYFKELSGSMPIEQAFRLIELNPYSGEVLTPESLENKLK